MSNFRFRPEMLEGVAEHLTEGLKQFEDWFILDAEDLKKITDHFVKELEKGLTKEGGNIVSRLEMHIMGEISGKLLTTDKILLHYAADECNMGVEVSQWPRNWKIPHSRYGWHESSGL